MNEDEKTMTEALARPFAANEVEWRAQRAGLLPNGKPWTLVFCYLTNRAIQNRLDEVFGIAGWRNEFTRWGEKSTLCGISCRINGEWITKFDGAEETGIEAVKGGFSDSMKRAAVQWGMGRYLYNLNENFAECTMDRRVGPEWRKTNTPDGQTVYWKIPALPGWALPAGKTPQASFDDPTAVMLAFMNSLDVTREQLELAVGMEVGAFAEKEFDLVRQAAGIMRKKNIGFQTAVMEIAQ